MIGGSAPMARAFEIFGWKFFEEEDDSANISDPVKYSLTFTPGEEDLAKDLQNASALYADQEKPVSGDLGLVIKARDDRDRLLAALYQKARYGALVTVKVDGTEIDQLPAVPTFPRDQPVPVTVDVVPGPVFTIGSVKLTGDAAQFNPTDHKLDVGTPAESDLVLKAADQIVADLEKQGRPLAKLSKRELVANHENNTATIVIGAEGGPVAPLGDIAVSGSKLVNKEFIEKWSRLREGKPYSPEEIKDSSERLRKLGTFSSVTITHPDQLDENGRIPMAINVSDGKQRYFGAGLQFSSLDGAGVLGYWGHRNLFGNAESLKISGSVARLGEATDFRDLDYSASIVFSKPAAFSDITTFNAGIVAAQVHPDSYLSSQVSIYSNIAWELSKQDTVTGGFDLTWNETQDTFGTHQYLVKSLPMSWVRDASDDTLNPTKGYKLTLNTQPSYEFYYKNIFSSFEGSLAGYKSLGAEDGVILAAKVSLGSLVGVQSVEEIPATRRFYAGGGGSVRGYAYQEISPYNSEGDAIGGRSYMLGSFEARIKITDAVGIVPFLDVGTVGRQEYPDFSDFRAGAGVGVRYATPFGPIRIDVAMPLKRYPDGSLFGIYAGIGQSF
jgi:translocation and assembly module TamA